MADEADQLVQTSDLIERQRETPVQLQLQFPRILLEASFESLLSNSTCSSTSTVKMAQSEPHSSLDESWASLDPSDYSQDEEVQDEEVNSELTDTCSLVDVSSTHDSDVEETEEDIIHSTVAVQFTRVEPDHTRFSSTRSCDQDESQPIYFTPLKGQSDPDVIHVKCDKNFDEEENGTDTTPIVVKESIRMVIAKDHYFVQDRPFSIAYHGSPSTTDSKEDILGKIAAALVPVRTGKDSTSQAPRYSVIPTEFESGSQPAFADLIPSQVEMAVNHISVTSSSNLDSRFVLTHSNEEYQSVYPGIVRQIPKDDWRPDLLVVLVGHDDALNDFSTVRSILDVAKDHFWPTMVIIEENIQGLYPENWCGHTALTRTQWIRIPAQDLCTLTQPIDVEIFLMINSSQLNKHINHLIRTAKQRYEHVRGDASFLSQAKHALAGLSRMWCGQSYTNTIVVKKVDPEKTAKDKDVITENWWSDTWNEFRSEYRQTHAQRVTSTLQFFKYVVMSWSICFAISTYRFGYPWSGTQTNNDVPSLPITPESTIAAWTVTTTSVPTATSIPTTTNIPTIQNDAVISGLSSLDRLWEKLVGATKWHVMIDQDVVAKEMEKQQMHHGQRSESTKEHHQSGTPPEKAISSIKESTRSRTGKKIRRTYLKAWKAVHQDTQSKTTLVEDDIQECGNVGNKTSFFQTNIDVWLAMMKSLIRNGPGDSPLLLKLDELGLRHECRRRSEDIQQGFNRLHRPELHLTSNVQRFNDRVLSFVSSQVSSLHKTTIKQLTRLLNSTAEQAANVGDIWRTGTETQKEMLSRAQGQARLLSKQIPRRKKDDAAKSD